MSGGHASPPSPKIILDTFFLHAVLKDRERQGISLHSKHSAVHGERLAEVMHDRNERSAGTGLNHWSHKCDDCRVKVYEDRSGMECEWINFHDRPKHVLLVCPKDIVSAAVTDGVTLGHPCCSEHECKIPLHTVKEEFCPVHAVLNLQCCIKGCQDARESGFCTCMLPAHRRQEADRASLKRRRPAKIYKRQEKEPNSKGVFSRKWTHNEQLMVRPCGIIVGRATFFSSESMSGVKVRRHLHSTLSAERNLTRPLSIVYFLKVAQGWNRSSCSSTTLVDFVLT